jgi:hypothetical protein
MLDQLPQKRGEEIAPDWQRGNEAHFSERDQRFAYGQLANPEPQKAYSSGILDTIRHFTDHRANAVSK